MAAEKMRVLIWAKTYPELSKKHAETVCTGAVREDGMPIRLYPVPLRYLADGQDYSLYDWIEVSAEKSTSDPRPESYRIIGESIRCLDRIGTGGGSWRARWEQLSKDPSWHFTSVGDLKTAQRATGRSFGLVTPGEIVGVRVVPKPESARAEFFAKRDAVQSQVDFFRPEYKELDFLPKHIVLDWHCSTRCPECADDPHRMKVLDWGLLQLARKTSWEASRSHLAAIADLSTHDFRLFLGNFRLRPRTFGIIGLWYPKLKDQLELI